MEPAQPFSIPPFVAQQANAYLSSGKNDPEQLRVKLSKCDALLDNVAKKHFAYLNEKIVAGLDCIDFSEWTVRYQDKPFKLYIKLYAGMQFGIFNEILNVHENLFTPVCIDQKVLLANAKLEGQRKWLFSCLTNRSEHEIRGLEFTSRRFSTLDQCVFRFYQLTAIGIGVNSFFIFPKLLLQSTTLTSINLRGVATLQNGTKLSTLPDEFTQLNNLEDLSLEYQGFKRFPFILCQLPSLISLNISRNVLSEIPPAIGQMTRLTYLIIAHNNLRTLPPQTARLTNLLTLNLGCNPLRELPDLGALVKLKNFDLFSCTLYEFPTWISNLVALEKMRFNGNECISLPDIFASLPNLGFMAINDNFLCEIPVSLCQHTRLTHLSLSHNKLDLGHLTFSQQIFVDSGSQQVKEKHT